jgi:hypothetical protein
VTAPGVEEAPSDQVHDLGQDGCGVGATGEEPNASGVELAEWERCERVGVVADTLEHAFRFGRLGGVDEAAVSWRDRTSA